MADKTREDVLKAALEEYGQHVNSWDDAFTIFESMMEIVSETGHPVAVFDALFMMYSFIVSMKQMPEEGDIKVLFAQTLSNLILNPKETLGFEIDFILKSDADRMADEAKARILTQVVSKLLQPVHDAVTEHTVEVSEPRKSTLH